MSNFLDFPLILAYVPVWRGGDAFDVHRPARSKSSMFVALASLRAGVYGGRLIIRGY